MLSEIAGSAEETVQFVLINDTQGCRERGHFRMRRVAVPFEVGPFPEEAPDILSTNKLQLGNGCLYLLAGPIVGRPNKEKFDGVPGEPLAFTNLITHVQRRTMTGPKEFFDGTGMLGDFFVGKGHGFSAVRFILQLKRSFAKNSS